MFPPKELKLVFEKDIALQSGAIVGPQETDLFNYKYILFIIVILLCVLIILYFKDNST